MDAVPDAALVPGVVSITALSTSGPRSGVPVLFQNANSSLVAQVVTDADGKASATMVAGGFVTTISPVASFEGSLHTFVGVKPGDELRDFIDDRGSMSVTVTVPFPAGAVGLSLWTTCHDRSNSSSIGLDPGTPTLTATVTVPRCAGMADVLVEAVANGEVTQTLYKANVALASGATIDLTTESFVALQDVDLSYSNVPGNGMVDLDVKAVTPNGFLGGLNGITRPSIPKVPAIPSSTLLVDAHSGRHRVMQWGVTSPYALDFGSLVLPSFASPPTINTSGTTLSWALTTTGQAPDFIVTNSTFERGIVWFWRIVSPYSPTNQLTLPVLPAPYDRFNPVGTSSSAITRSTGVLYKFPGGFDAGHLNAVSDDFTKPLPHVPSGTVVSSTGF